METIEQGAENGMTWTAAEVASDVDLDALDFGLEDPADLDELGLLDVILFDQEEIAQKTHLYSDSECTGNGSPFFDPVDCPEMADEEGLDVGKVFASDCPFEDSDLAPLLCNDIAQCQTSQMGQFQTSPVEMEDISCDKDVPTNQTHVQTNQMKRKATDIHGCEDPKRRPSGLPVVLHTSSVSETKAPQSETSPPSDSKTSRALAAELAANAAKQAELEANMTPAELKRLKNEQKKARNREHALASRNRRKQRMALLEEENKRLRELNARLQAQLQGIGSSGGLSPEADLESDSNSVSTAADREDCSSVHSRSSSYATLPTTTKELQGQSFSIGGSSANSKDSPLLKGAAAIGVTMSMVLFTDSTAPGSPMSDGSFEMIGFWALGWDFLRYFGLSNTLLTEFFALMLFIALTVSLVSLYYFRTFHINRSSSLTKGLSALLPTVSTPKQDQLTRSFFQRSRD